MQIARLKELIVYEPETGAITWAVSRGRVKSGDPANSPNGYGYLRVCIDRKSFMAHRVAWAMHYGEWPSKFIDHINGNKSDNRICNLRLATRSENAQNVKRPYRSNKTGFAGVHYVKALGKYQAQICVNGKTKFLGRFMCVQKAYEVYERAKKELHPFAV